MTRNFNPHNLCTGMGVTHRVHPAVSRPSLRPHGCALDPPHTHTGAPAGEVQCPRLCQPVAGQRAAVGVGSGQREPILGLERENTQARAPGPCSVPPDVTYRTENSKRKALRISGWNPRRGEPQTWVPSGARKPALPGRVRPEVTVLLRRKAATSSRELRLKQTPELRMPPPVLRSAPQTGLPSPPSTTPRRSRLSRPPARAPTAGRGPGRAGMGAGAVCLLVSLSPPRAAAGRELVPPVSTCFLRCLTQPSTHPGVRAAPVRNRGPGPDPTLLAL